MRPHFVAPELDPELHIAHCVTPIGPRQALAATPGAVAATVVSPTYFGAVADVAGLAEVAHARGVPLVVDEAWGAHLAFHDDLPAHALSLGADLVISSVHKVVGSLTQSAMVHLGHGDRVDELVVDRCVTLVESTSPSALLGGSVDAARRHAAVDGQVLAGRDPDRPVGSAGRHPRDPRGRRPRRTARGRPRRARLRPAAARDRRSRHWPQRLRRGRACWHSTT